MEPWKLVVALGFALGARLLISGGTAWLALHLGGERNSAFSVGSADP